MGWRTSVRPRWIFSRPRRFPGSREPVFICSDMPIEELAQDMEFSKKWMLGLAAILKKGLRLDMVHDLNRPFGEMMLGLESWIPLYMDGTDYAVVSPRADRTPVLRASACSVPARWRLRANASPGILLMAATCFPNPGSDLAYYRTARRSHSEKGAATDGYLLRDGGKTSYGSFLAAEALKPGKRRSLLTTLPTPHAFGGMSLSRLLEKKRRS